MPLYFSPEVEDIMALNMQKLFKKSAARSCPAGASTPDTIVSGLVEVAKLTGQEFQQG